MRLGEAHRDDLWSIAKRGLATLASVFLFWGTTAVTFFPDEDIYKLSSYSGIFASVVVIGCFSSSYRNLLAQGITDEQRQLGFILFWFTGSAGFNFLWRLPYWLFQSINQAPRTADGFWWKIVWWSYTLHDSWYDSSSGFVIAFEAWRVLSNTVGCFGLYRYFMYTAGFSDGKIDSVEHRGMYVQACLLFVVTGTLQLGNAVIYALLTVSRYQHAEHDILGQVILWSLNGFSQLASMFALIFACRLLLRNHSRLETKRS
jgi:hypothetical protein